jgi:hypothetical protein
MSALNTQFDLFDTEHVPAGDWNGEMRQRSRLTSWGNTRICKNSGNEAKRLVKRKDLTFTSSATNTLPDANKAKTALEGHSSRRNRPGGDAPGGGLPPLQDEEKGAVGVAGVGDQHPQLPGLGIMQRQVRVIVRSHSPQTGRNRRQQFPNVELGYEDVGNFQHHCLAQTTHRALFAVALVPSLIC